MLQPIFDQFMADILITGVFDRINTNLRPAHPTCQADGMVPIDYGNTGCGVFKQGVQN